VPVEGPEPDPDAAADRDSLADTDLDDSPPDDA
jgi:hypothetical protein